MKSKLNWPVVHWPIFRWQTMVLLAAILLPACAAAQSDDNSVPLGDVARALRKDKEKEKENKSEPATGTVIDNDNLSKVMDQAESQRLKGGTRISFSSGGNELHVSSPDVTCSLSFNAPSGASPSDPFMPQDLPRSELLKLDGPATIDGDSLQVTVRNGTEWNIQEITVGLTIVRRSDTTAAYYGSATLRPASATNDTPAEKRSDLTVLYHLKGASAPFSTTVFQQNLGVTLSPDQDWHWAIVQAQGIPPK